MPKNCLSNASVLRIAPRFYFAQTYVHLLNRIGRLNDRTDLRWGVEEYGSALPVSLPRLHDRWVVSNPQFG